MMIRGIDRAHDIDLGPSGHASVGHHFESLWGPSHVAKPNHRRSIGPRCLYVMRNGFACQRPETHPGKHGTQS